MNGRTMENTDWKYRELEGVTGERYIRQSPVNSLGLTAQQIADAYELPKRATLEQVTRDMRRPVTLWAMAYRNTLTDDVIAAQFALADEAASLVMQRN